MNFEESEQIVTFIALLYPQYEVSVVDGENLTAGAFAQVFCDTPADDVMSAVMHISKTQPREFPPNVSQVYDVVRSRTKTALPSPDVVRSEKSFLRDSEAAYAKKGIYRQSFVDPATGNKTFRYTRGPASKLSDQKTRDYYTKMFERTKLLNKGMTPEQLDRELEHMERAIKQSSNAHMPKETEKDGTTKEATTTASQDDETEEAARSLSPRLDDSLHGQDFEELQLPE